MEFLSKTTQDTKELAGIISKKLKPKDIIALYGSLGSGKTTFTKYLVESLGFDVRVQSPTFVIARTYTDGNNSANVKIVNHIDLYRLTTKKEAADIGLEELWEDSNAITIIEWPEIIADTLPEKTIHIKFEETGEEQRKIYVQNLH